jgi:hypothetical protein
MSEAWQQFPSLSVEEQARRAGELIQDPLLNTVLAEMDTTAVTTWRNASNAVQREEQYHMICAIADLRKRLNGKLESLKMLEHGRSARSRPTN